MNPKPLAAQPADDAPDVVELLLECHQRIRDFTALARRLGEAEGLADEEVRGTAARIRRYFAEALPLHVADEEQSVTPRLQGREPELDAALARMAAEHRDHEPLLANLVATCEALEASPDLLADVRETLVDTASALAEAFATHLGEEERVILPAVSRVLSPDVRRQLAAQVRTRRHHAWHG